MGFSDFTYHMHVQVDSLEDFEKVTVNCGSDLARDIGDSVHVMDQHIMLHLSQRLYTHANPRLHVVFTPLFFGLYTRNSELYRYKISK